MSQTPPDSRSAETTTGGSWKQITNNGIAAGIGAIIFAVVVGAYAAIEGVVRGSMPDWLHAIAMHWLLTICATVVVFVVGFIMGVSYAAAASIYVIEYLWKSIFHLPRPKREWWLAPIDWLTVASVWLGLMSIFARFYVSEGIKSIRTRSRSPVQPVDDERDQLRAENAQLREDAELAQAEAEHARAEAERLRTENERLRAQERHTTEE